MSENKQRCIVCEEGDLETLTESRTVDEHGAAFTVDGLKYQVCSNCGVEQVGATELRQNKQLIMAARKRAKNLLTGEEVREVRKNLGLTQQQAAVYFGGGTNAFSKYETEVVEQSVSMDRLLRITNRAPELVGYLRIFSLNVESVSVFVGTTSGSRVPELRRSSIFDVTSGTSTAARVTTPYIQKNNLKENCELIAI